MHVNYGMELFLSFAELTGKLDNWQAVLDKSLVGAITPPSYMLDPVSFELCDYLEVAYSFGQIDFFHF
jgi:hypothetical protein